MLKQPHNIGFQAWATQKVYKKRSLTYFLSVNSLSFDRFDVY